MAESWNPYDILPTMTEKTVEWISEQSSDQPFFVYLAFNSPHYPIVPNKEFHGKSKAGYYGDFVIETDAMVGKVLTALEEDGLAKNTLVIFSADNGAETHAFERLEAFDQWSSAEFRGVKRDIYEGGHRVPFIVRWPGIQQAPFPMRWLARLIWRRHSLTLSAIPSIETWRSTVIICCLC